MNVSVVGEGVVIVFRVEVADVEEEAKRKKIIINMSYKLL